MKKPDLKNNPILAFMLSFLFPGVGLFYLKEWIKGFINLGAAIGIGLLLAPGDSIIPIYLPIFIGIASGSWAYLEADKFRHRHPEEDGCDTK